MNILPLAVFPDKYIEKERLEELITLIENLRLRTRLLADTITNFKPVTGSLPKEKDMIIANLQYIIDTTSEDEMVNYRNGLQSLGRV